MGWEAPGTRMLVSAFINVGVADKVLTFRVPFPCRIIALEAAADAADGTDYCDVSLRTGTTTLYTVTVNNADTVNRDTDEANGESSRWNEGDTLNLLFDFSGTAANVLGVYAVVWCRPAR